MVDNTIRGNGNQVMTPVVRRYSDDLKRFAEQFAPVETPNGKPISRKHMIQERQPDDRTDQNLVAIMVSVGRVIYRVFDAENRAFLDTYGRDVSAPRCEVRCSALIRNRGEGSVVYAIRVVKRVEVRDTRRPTARQSFRDRRNDDDDDD